MTVQSINALISQTSDINTPLESIKIPKIAGTVRAVFEEVSPKITVQEQEYLVTKRLLVPNLELKAFNFREQAAKATSNRTINTVLSAGGASAAGGVIAGLYHVAMGSLGWIGSSLSLVTTGAALYRFVPRSTAYTPSLDLNTEIEAFKTFFSKKNCKYMQRKLETKIRANHDLPDIVKLYTEALRTLKEARGYIC